MKPSDFFLGVVNFLGALVPGAILAFWIAGHMNHAAVASLAAMARDFGAPGWLVFGAFAYVLGQFLLGATVMFNQLAQYHWLAPTLHADLNIMRHQAREKLELLHHGSDEAKFHGALCFLRTQNAAATAEVDHHMADYKLLRNLLAVLAIDLTGRIVPLFSGQSAWAQAWLILALECALIGVCFWAFVQMFNWAQLLCFQYVCLLPQKQNVPAKEDATQ